MRVAPARIAGVAQQQEVLYNQPRRAKNLKIEYPIQEHRLVPDRISFDLWLPAHTSLRIIQNAVYLSSDCLSTLICTASAYFMISQAL